MTKNARFSLLPLFTIVSAALFASCNDQGETQTHPTGPQVTVHVVEKVPLAVTTELPGRITAFRIAGVRPQVSRIVPKRNFTEGSDIESGQSLYQIDPVTYQTSYDSAKGELVGNEAAAAVAYLMVKRYMPLIGTKYISQQEYDQTIADARQADASVIAAKAVIESACINLAYIKVTSPISGHIGKSDVTEGALVTNGQVTELATAQQLDPIHVDAIQPNNDFIRLRQPVKQRDLYKDGASSTVELVMENGQSYPLKDSLQLSDVTVGENTGSITLRTAPPDPQCTLLLGMFVCVRIDESVQLDATFAPQQGVTHAPCSDIAVTVINGKSQAESRAVVTAQAIGGRRLISEGLQPGDKVIANGLQKACPGVQVKATADTKTPATKA